MTGRLLKPVPLTDLSEHLTCARADAPTARSRQRHARAAGLLAFPGAGVLSAPAQSRRAQWVGAEGAFARSCAALD